MNTNILISKFFVFYFMTMTTFALFSSCGSHYEKSEKEVQMKKETCNSKKLEVLLRNLLKKSFLFPKFTGVNENDSTISYYLRLINFTMQKKDFYVYLSNSDINDSVKLIQTDTMMTAGREVGVKILEINEDTSKIKISIGFGANRIASTQGTYNYVFNKDSCTWIMKDSTFWQY